MTSNYTNGFVQVYHEVKSLSVVDVKRFYDNKDTLDYWFILRRDGFIGSYTLTDGDKKLVDGICLMLIDKLAIS